MDFLQARVPLDTDYNALARESWRRIQRHVKTGPVRCTSFVGHEASATAAGLTVKGSIRAMPLAL